MGTLHLIIDIDRKLAYKTTCIHVCTERQIMLREREANGRAGPRYKFEINNFEEELEDESISSSIVDHKTTNVHVGCVHNTCMSNADQFDDAVQVRDRELSSSSSCAFICAHGRGASALGGWGQLTTDLYTVSWRSVRLTDLRIVHSSRHFAFILFFTVV